MIKYITSFIKSLNANAHPGDIAHAVALGLFSAILPKDNLTFMFIFFFTVFIRVNKGAFFLSFILFGFVTPFMDVLINRIGFWAVQLEIIRPAFIWCENTPFIGLFKLSNTMVLGGLVFGAVLYIPCYFVCIFIIAQYRKRMQRIIPGVKGAGLISKIPLLRRLFAISDIKDSI